MDNIEKLLEKVSKDPSSKLFVPLADEYKKAGQADKAIEVLKAGLERQPSYMSARVALGKIYLEKSMTAEAKEEFEKVIKAIPDNLFAQRKLADICKEQGEIANAISRYKTVLKLNPLDEEALLILRGLESGEGAAAEITTEGILETTLFEPTKAEETGTFAGQPVEAVETLEVSPSFELPEAEITGFESAAAEETPADETIEWKFDDAPPSESQAEEVFSFNATPPETMAEEAGTESAEEPGVLSFDIEKEAAGASDLDEIQEEIAALPETEPEIGVLELSEDEIPAELLAETGPLSAEFAPLEGNLPGAMEAEGLPDFSLDEEEALEEIASAPLGDLMEEGIGIPASPEAAEKEMEDIARMGEAADIAMADAYISEGNYGEALRVYGSLLRADPQDKKTLQRVHELKGLLKFLGKDKEILIARLEAFLEGIRKRRHEFFGAA